MKLIYLNKEIYIDRSESKYFRQKMNFLSISKFDLEWQLYIDITT